MTVASALNDMNNAILDLQQADYNTFDRPLRKLAKALQTDELKDFNDALKRAVDFEAFINGSEQGSSMMGSASLSWPDDKAQELGLTITLIEKGAENPNWFMNFGHEWFYDGNKVIAGIRKMTKSVLIPFGRDYKAYVQEQLPAPVTETRPADKSKVFIVHGHDEGPRETLARFIEQLGLEAVILHEKASGGMTIPEKLAKYGNVGFAVVLLTPDDFGRAKKDVQERARARQNVILELGYFVGRLGRDKVCGLLKGDIEIPSDYVGTVYVSWDEGGAWKLSLAKELNAAGYDIDFNKLIKAG
ncbi:putative nucleotide-binding protein containing TIR-like domain [Rhizobium leguminosarum bv. trifolii WSM597]|uniref:Putative nucleotide-binding protein containing TIR-like domain n=1 Tax=Rhizobium leguminosarum bv. trifolii WSM597 TaxID=754764 RepID=J0GW34_RHILT|nr:nucleotide-binding protein [Rhizobium leguminosarum]EJB01743.1 putative nucleotide-binding protein containing TIR-like domain [Rhizobium leguminosarum bv. trifolii WSM597]